jgi:DNA-binding MarR family transcriptional regulator
MAEGPTDEIVALLFELMGQMRNHFQTCLVEFDLSPPQAHAIRGLEPGCPVPMRELAKQLHCDASNVTGIVDRLEARGLVARRVGAADRRVKELVVTDAGAQLRHQLHERLRHGAPVVARLTPDEQRMFRELLAKAVGREDPGGGQESSAATR